MKCFIFRSVLLVLPLVSLLTAAEDRIAGTIDGSRSVALKGHVHPAVRGENDRGRLAGSTRIGYVSLVMRPAASLESFLAAQQTPGSPEYHRWLTPEQFGERFGLSRNDVDKTVRWLESEGLEVHDVARGRNWISFSGTAENMGRAFHTEFRRYAVDGQARFANSSEPSVPKALEGVVAGFTGLNDIGREPLSRERPTYEPLFNSGSRHSLAPDDFATIYNLTPLYEAGFDGTGQKIAVIGRTAISMADIRAFRKQFNLPANDPELVLVGTDPGIRSSTDLLEAHLDLEWAGAIARNATILYVYSRSVDTSVQYAIDQNIAPVITFSYGLCEAYDSPATRYQAQQANAQGITWLVASGDAGAATCDTTAPTPQASKGPLVSSPANLPEVTAVGGTVVKETSRQYWAATNGVNGGSALSYIPEAVWNDSADFNGLAAGGGGRSMFFPKPFWQAGPGVPDDKARDIPDIALSASPITGAYRVTSGGVSHDVGGTSAGTPAFAGVVAILNQYLLSKSVLSQAGLGNINPTLYRLARSKPEAFHDVVEGHNKVPCAQASPGCVDGLVGFSAGPGYDLATGLGSIDAHLLVTNWETGSASTTELSASPESAGITDLVQLRATVRGGAAVPTGSVSFLVNDDLLGTVSLTAGDRAAQATLSVPAMRAAGGYGVVTALYSGDGVYNSSAGTASFQLKLPSSGSLVVASVGPNPVYPQSSNNGFAWFFTVTLTEKAGAGTRLTGFRINNTNYSDQIASFFGSSTIPALGSISTGSLGLTGVAPPQDTVFVFSGVDGDGTTWSRQVTVPFVGAVGKPLNGVMRLTSTPSMVVQNPQSADPACPWSQQVVVEELNGFSIVLSRFTATAADFTPRISQLFGTNRLAPFGRLQATLCWNDVAPPATKTLSITGTSEIGSTITATAIVSYRAPSSVVSGAVLSVNPAAGVTVALNPSESAEASLDLNFGGASPQWSVSTLPTNGANWLAVSRSSGTGAAKVSLQLSTAGLSNGVYQAVIAVQSQDSIPQFVNVPVTLIMGGSANTTIAGVANGGSFTQAFAPGMLLSVFGTGLSPGTAAAREFPLPLTLSGVSATVNGISAPLYYVSPGQLNVQVPYEAGAGPAVLGVNNNGQVAAFPFTIAPSAPGLFTDPSGNLVPASTAQQGQPVVAYITGEGDATPTLATGATPALGTAASRLPRPRLPLAVTVGGVAAEVLFAGVPPQMAGVTQINFTVPANAPTGPQAVIVTVGGISSQAATLNVTRPR